MIEIRETKHDETNKPIAWRILEAGNLIGNIEWNEAKHTHTLELAPQVGLLEQGDTDTIYEFIRNANRRRPPADVPNTPTAQEKTA